MSLISDSDTMGKNLQKSRKNVLNSPKLPIVRAISQSPGSACPHEPGKKSSIKEERMML
jgi:hypothetical protein